MVVMMKEINHCCLTFYRREQSQTRSNLLNNTGETNSVIARTEANNICLIRHFPISGETQYKELCVSGASRKCPWLKKIKVKLTLTRWESGFTNICFCLSIIKPRDASLYKNKDIMHLRKLAMVIILSLNTTFKTVIILDLLKSVRSKF